MYQHELKVAKKKAKKRIGRGNGSGHGTFSTRGCKGQNSRSGGGKGAMFEGGQTPLIRKMPKLRGFKNPNKIKAKVINLETLEKHFQENDTVNLESLFAKKLIAKKTEHVKILGMGTLTKKLKIELPISKKANAKII